MRRLTLVLLALGVVLSGVGWLTVSVASAETKAERQRAAAELVAEALFCEVYGKDAQRNELLESALDKVPGYVPVLWHTGHVRVHDKWLKFDELPELAAEDQRLSAYGSVRREYPKTLQGRLALAEWCAKKKLIDQQRAHLTEVLAINPDHRQARQLLGFRLVDGAWLSQQEISQAAVRTRQVSDALRQWTPRLTQIRKALRHRSQHQREEATKRLRAIADPAAIPAIELVFCADDHQDALLGVETLDQISTHEAAVALARQAVFSPWQDVRKSAAQKLKTRDKQHYVPPLLSALQSPVQSRAGLYQEPSGRLAYRHIFYREGEGHRELAVLDTRYYRSFLTAADASVDGEAATYRPLTGQITRLRRAPRKDEDGPTITAKFEEWQSLDYRAQVQRDASIKALATEMALARQNAVLQKLNQSVFSVLSVATGAFVPPTPESWWQWWNQYNEVYVPGYKPLRTAYRRDDRDAPTGVGRSVTGNFKVVEFKASCLAAGSTVWTESGPTPIEQIEVGDRVLSQDIETGCLAYKPVLRTTVRPPAELIKFKAGGKTIVCTGGHPFWVCGDGWLMARHIMPGARCHQVTGTAPTGSVEMAGKGPAYNLVVADFHTYFVGDAKILSHDNTIRRPTNAQVPGLKDL